MKPFQPVNRDKLWKMIETSKGKNPATTWITGGKILNVYTGELERGDIVLYQDRMVYVGMDKPLIDQHTVVIDASDFTLVPGYIEPHAHPFQVYHLTSLGEYALTLGTTTMVNDNLLFYLSMDTDQIEHLMEYSSRLPVKNFWWARLDPQSNHPDMIAKFTKERLMRVLQHERVVQAGELTAWPQALAGDKTILDGIVEAKRMGKKIEGHAPGASAGTLSALAALGVTADHEAINGEEVLRRLRLGMYATLRHSSIRPDLPDLIKGLQALEFDFSTASRLMLTTDGSAPPFLVHGFLDFLIKLAIDNGVPAPSAYRMATLNPATYFGLDQEIGGIAPGRIADILFLEGLNNPTPVHVMVNGEMAVKEGQLLKPFPACNWARLGFVPMKSTWSIEREWLDMNTPNPRVPVIQLINAVITKTRVEEFALDEGSVSIEDRKGYCYISLIDHHGKWVANGILKGFADHLDALATTYTSSQDILVIGQNKQQMAKAVNFLLNQGGGTILRERDATLFYLPLPLQGEISNLPMDVLISETTALANLLKDRGYSYQDPFYTLFFLTSTYLPSIRITAEGIYSIKDNRSLFPIKRI